jgi:hypothetical protein
MNSVRMQNKLIAYLAMQNIIIKGSEITKTIVNKQIETSKAACVFLHHDAITGTCSQAAYNDYVILAQEAGKLFEENNVVILSELSYLSRWTENKENYDKGVNRDLINQYRGELERLAQSRTTLIVLNPDLYSKENVIISVGVENNCVHLVLDFSLNELMIQ